MTTVLVALLAVAVGVLTVIMFGLLRTHAEILRALDRLGVSLDDQASAASPRSAEMVVGADSDGVPGRRARDIVGVSPGGGPAKVSVTDVDHLTLLAFLSSGCRTCERFWGAIADPGLELPGTGTRLVIVGQDPAHESESVFAALVPAGMKAVMSTAAWHDYDCPGSPYFALVDGSTGRVVGAGTATSWEQMSGLLGQALGDEVASADARRGRVSGRRRAQRADAALLAAGISPGHSSLGAPIAERADNGSLGVPIAERADNGSRGISGGGASGDESPPRMVPPQR